MEMKKPIYERLGLPKQANHKLVWEYLTSKSTTKSIPKLVQAGDSINRNIDISYYLACNDLCKTEKLLSHKKKLYAEKREQLDKCWVELSKKEEQLRQSFIEYNKFVHENYEKRERSRVKIEEQRILLTTRIEQVQTIREDWHCIAEVKRIMDENIIKFKIYEDFLNEVVQTNPDEFKDITFILNRYISLLHAKKELRKQYQINVMTLVHAKMDFDNLIEKHYVKISGLKTKLAFLYQRYETVKFTCQKWESIHQHIVTEALKKVAEVMAIKDSCWHIYRDVCKRRGIEPVFKDDYGKQFDFIKKALLEFEIVNCMVNEVEEEKLRLSEKPCISGDVD